MSELPPNPNERPRFLNPRDEALYTMAMEAWAGASGGSRYSPVGWFARISNSEVEMQEIVDAFGAEFESIGLYSTRGLVGNFLVVENRLEQVDVREFEDEDQLIEAFELKKRQYEFLKDLLGPEGPPR